MLVKELIKELQKYDEDLEVITFTEEDDSYGTTLSVEHYRHQVDMPYSTNGTPLINRDGIIVIEGDPAK